MSKENINKREIVVNKGRTICRQSCVTSFTFTSYEWMHVAENHGECGPPTRSFANPEIMILSLGTNPSPVPLAVDYSWHQPSWQ